MKKVVKLTESDLVKIIERVIEEGKTDKGVKEKDVDVKIETFQDSIKNHLKSKDNVTVKKVGDDYEIHCDGDHVGQVMFRKEGITVKKVGNKFGKKFDFNELGNIKKEINRIIKED
jgi:nucleoid DNA-binding protein